LVRNFFKVNYLGIIIGLLLAVGLYLISLYSYTLYHSLVELFSVVVGFTIFVIAWNSKKFLDNNYLLFVGIAYLFITLVDLFHTLSYKGMGVFTNFTGSNLATQLWISARYIEGISMLLAIFFITRRLNYKIQLISYLIATILLLLTIFYWKIFPVCFIEGSGLTTFKIVSEYIICFILAAAIFFLYLYRNEFNKTVYIMITGSLIITILSELSFTLYSDVYGLFNQLGHFLKILSFFLIYKAIIETGFSQPLDLLFFKLKQSEKDIIESEEKFRSLYYTMNEGASLNEMIFDKSNNPVDFRILDVNNAYLSILGLKRNQIIGKKASEVFKINISPYINVYAKAADSGEPARFENYFAPMKKYFSISVFSPSRGKFAIIFSDITERKNSEMEIESLSRFPSENPNPVMRVSSKNLIIYKNEPAKKLLQQLGDDKSSKFLKVIINEMSSLKKNKNAELKSFEIKIGKLIYGFNAIYVKEYNYFNIYGKDITSKKEAERMQNIIRKEKTLSEERNKLARELHDTVTQTLFSANLIAEAIPKLWKKDPETVIEKLEEVRQLNKVALAEMRVLLYELKPSAIKGEDMGDLLRGLIKSVEVRSRISVELIINGEYKFPLKIEFGFYRIAQEALNNIVKHSCATKANLILKTYPEKLYMEINDNGRGFDDKKISSTNLGLAIMRERSKLMGALLTIDTVPGKGTRIIVIYNKKQTSKTSNNE